jgi:alpha-glucosidase
MHLESQRWWSDAAVYQVYPRSFADGNHDGEGDLLGVIDHLDYIAALGVDALWLSPFYPSPKRDSGYDVSDPRDVDPLFGTLADMQRLIDEAHQRGLRVIIDVVPNHVSDQHAWFQEACNAPPGSLERARFHFRDGKGTDGAEPPNNWLSMFGGPAWTRIEEADGSPGQWYLHLFDSSQPELNWSNGEVDEYWLTTLRHWLDMGVDGFRVDVALGLAKDMTYPDLLDPAGLIQGLRLDLDDGSDEALGRRAQVANSPVFDRDEVQDIYRKWRSLLNEYDGDRMAVAEAWVPGDRAARYVAPDTLHQIFGFDFLIVPWDAQQIRRRIHQTMEAVAPAGALPTWALSNHDTRRLVSRLGGGTVGTERARALALLTHALPGSVYIFQGEELGLPDADMLTEERRDPIFLRTGGLELGRDGSRVPLPWSGDRPPFGFTSTRNTPLWLPQPQDWSAYTVAAEESDPFSTLYQYRNALWMRRAHPGLAENSDATIHERTDDVVVVTRGSGFVCVLNASQSTAEIYGTVLLASRPEDMPALQRGKLAPNTAVWLQS